MVHGRMSVLSAALVFIFGASIANAKTNHEAVPGEFLVTIKKNNGAAANTIKSLANISGVEGARVVIADRNLYVIKRNLLETEAFAVNALRSTDLFSEVVPNYIMRVNKMPNDPMFGELWGIRNSNKEGTYANVDVGATAAWDIETGNKNVIVAVIDTGVDYTHPDLAANMWTNEAERNGAEGVDDDNNGFVDDIYGYDFVNNDADPMDDYGHGTHCAGTIGAKGNDGKGIVGVAWDVSIMAIKFLSEEGTGTLEDAIKAIDYANKMGAVIQSNSWSGGGYNKALEDVIKAAKDKGYLFVAAAGNDYISNDEEPSYPATYAIENIISVAAIDNMGYKADFSNYGKKTVHVAAPGVGVLSAVPQSIDSNMYDRWDGTSMATPHVAGIAALLKAKNPNFNHQDMKSAIMKGARPIGILRNLIISGGVANAYYALLGETAPLDMEDPFNWTSMSAAAETSHPYDANTKKEYRIHVPGASRVSVYFNIFETESGYDFVEFRDATGKTVAKWDGEHNEEFSPAVDGDTMILYFTSDDSVNRKGFKVTKVAYK